MEEHRKPPQPPLIYNQTPDSILKLFKDSTEASRKVHDEVCSTVTPATATFANTLLPLALVENESLNTAQYVALFQGVSPDPDIRAAASEAMKLFGEAATEADAREDIFALVESVFKKAAPSPDPESQRYHEKKYQNFLRNGLGFEPGPKRERLKELKLGIQQCIRDFVDNLAEGDDAMWLSVEDLDGLPQSTIDALEASSDGSKRRLTFEQPDVTAILKYARSEDTRRRVFIGDANCALANVAIFKQCVELRDEMARLLGHRNFVEYAFQERMAESQESVEAFLEELSSSLRPRALKHMDRLRDLKREDVRSNVGGDDVELYLWDKSYYNQKLMKEHYRVDQAKIAEFFPAQVAIRGMLDTFEMLFGIVIIEEKTDGNTDLVWHPDVQLFSVWDNNAEGGAFVGYLYTDIYPRKGKYGHNADFNINPGFTDREGKRHYPSTALVCNLNYPTATKPSLLEHRQVVTLFHELGHGMHDLLSRTRYARFHGYQVARDFGEMPSQMLEHYCWIPSVLQKMSRHYSYLSLEYKQAWLDDNPDAHGIIQPKTIPDEVVDELVYAKNITAALDEVRQVALAKFDLEVYGQASPEDTAAVDPSVCYNRSMRETGLVPGPEVSEMGLSWGHGHVQTNHFIWGNEACYYGYKYSQVFSADVFNFAFEKDPFDSEAGRRYEHMVLEKGGSQDEMKTLKDFLGRSPNMIAFRKELEL